MTEVPNLFASGKRVYRRVCSSDLPLWILKIVSHDRASEAIALMQKLDEYLKAKNFDEAEKTADETLKLMFRRE
jgi:hypothetical protein